MISCYYSIYATKDNPSFDPLGDLVVQFEMVTFIMGLCYGTPWNLDSPHFALFILNIYHFNNKILLYIC